MRLASKGKRREENTADTDQELRQPGPDATSHPVVPALQHARRRRGRDHLRAGAYHLGDRERRRAARPAAGGVAPPHGPPAGRRAPRRRLFLLDEPAATPPPGGSGSAARRGAAAAGLRGWPGGARAGDGGGRVRAAVARRGRRPDGAEGARSGGDWTFAPTWTPQLFKLVLGGLWGLLRRGRAPRSGWSGEDGCCVVGRGGAEVGWPPRSLGCRSHGRPRRAALCPAAGSACRRCPGQRRIASRYRARGWPHFQSRTWERAA